jgi:hypothetical protein
MTLTSQQEADILLAEHQAKRRDALNAFYDGERNSGVSPLIANERLHFHAKRMDAAFERDLETIRQCMERT